MIKLQLQEIMLKKLPMNGTQGDAAEASTCLYLVKFFLESMMALQASNCDMVRWLTCSQVRFRRRIGGVLRPEIIAAIVEKLLRFRQRCGIIRQLTK